MNAPTRADRLPVSRRVGQNETSCTDCSGRLVQNGLGTCTEPQRVVQNRLGTCTEPAASCTSRPGDGGQPSSPNPKPRPPRLRRSPQHRLEHPRIDLRVRIEPPRRPRGEGHVLRKVDSARALPCGRRQHRLSGTGRDEIFPWRNVKFAARSGRQVLNSKRDSSLIRFHHEQTNPLRDPLPHTAL